MARWSFPTWGPSLRRRHSRRAYLGARGFDWAGRRRRHRRRPRQATEARSETASALAGGVTTVLSYFRTGQNYLNKSGPYRTIFPEVVAATVGHTHTDFGYHIGVMTTEQLGEVDWLVGEQGVGSFKYYMFYKGLNLTSDSMRGSAHTMADTYDLGHLYLLMRQVAAAA
jgi:dihydropyrimidinase/allantoinase